MRNLIVILMLLVSIIFACSESENVKNEADIKTEIQIKEEIVRPPEKKQECNAGFEFIHKDNLMTVYLTHGEDVFELFQEPGNYTEYDIREISASKFMPKNASKIHANFYEVLVRLVYIVCEKNELVAYHLYYDESTDDLRITELKRIALNEKS